VAAFQSGFSMGAALYQQAQANKERDEQRKAQEEERKLRMEQLRLGLDTQRAAVARDQERAALLRGMRDFATGVDPAATSTALNADFDRALAASDAAVKAENAARVQGVAPEAAPATPAIPAVRGGSNMANEAALTVRNAVDPTAPEYRQGMNRRMLDLALFDGNTQAAQTLQTEGRKMADDDLVAAKVKEYKGTDEQIGATAQWLNETSKRITMGDPDKNGLVRVSVVGPDRRAEFLKLSRADQARLYAAGHLLERNPEQALQMMAGINKTLAEAVAAENNLTSLLAGNTNDVASKGQSMTLARNADSRAGAAVTDARTERTRTQEEAKAKADAAVALYKEQNPNATPAQLEAVRRGVMPTAEKVQSDFKPDAFGAGGTVVQREPDGSLTVTRVDQQGKAAPAVRVPRPGAQAAAAGRPGAQRPQSTPGAQRPQQRPNASATQTPVDKRVVGQVYDSPRGPVIWRGTGWELVNKPTP